MSPSRSARSRPGRALRGCAAALLAGVLLAGCGGQGGFGTPVPTFQAGAEGGPAAGGPAATDFTATLGRDCAPILQPADVVTLFGMPLDTVTARSTVGVAAPAVGRTERLTCRYTGTEGGSARGQTLLDLNVGRFESVASAAAQWEINAGVESGVRTDLMIGAARAALFDRPRDSTLMVVYDDTTLTFVLPGRPLPGDRPRGDMLVDFALRALAVVEPPATAVTGTVPPVVPTPTRLEPPADPAVAAGE